MSDFNPGEGWREVPLADPLIPPSLVEYDEMGNHKRRWVREEPVPPLPIEPFTVIRMRHVYGSGSRARYVLEDDGRWRLLDTQGGLVEPLVLMQEAAAEGFEVLAEPWSVERGDRIIEATRSNTRRETAKIIRREIVRTFSGWAITRDIVNIINREFGLED